MGTEKAVLPKPLFPELRAWMEKTGTRQLELARILNVSEPSITNYLSGETAWPTEIALRLSLLTEIPVEKFVSREVARLLKLLGDRSSSPDGNTKDDDNVA
jgi:transcriptional regulator with XRE-family HTH domain